MQPITRGTAVRLTRRVQDNKSGTLGTVRSMMLLPDDSVIFEVRLQTKRTVYVGPDKIRPTPAAKVKGVNREAKHATKKG